MSEGYMCRKEWVGMKGMEREGRKMVLIRFDSV